MAHVFTVTELSRAVKDTLEPAFPVVWVRGQVSNISRPGSGHIYFILKDEEAVIAAAWFKNNHALSVDSRGRPLAQSLQEGSEVVCAGRLSVYLPRGTYQLIPELVQEQGMGGLHMQFEALKEKLRKEGLFSEQGKKGLPLCPKKVAVITAANGAALQDFLRVAEQYGLGGEILVYPVHVQGEHAEQEIVLALNQVNNESRAEVAVLIRGGGSLEDLWPFNTEGVARAIFASRLPVLTGIGHEVDTCIADLAADKRAATPTHAVQALWPERTALHQRSDEQSTALLNAMHGFLRNKEERLVQGLKALNWLGPGRQLKRTLDRVGEAEGRLVRSCNGLVRDSQHRLQGVENRLKTLFAPRTWNERRQRIDYLLRELKRSLHGYLSERESGRILLHEKLTGLDPYRPLNKGYALVRVQGEKDFVRSCRQVTAGDDLDIRVQSGAIFARVTGIEKDK